MFEVEVGRALCNPTAFIQSGNKGKVGRLQYSVTLIAPSTLSLSFLPYSILSTLKPVYSKGS